MEQKKKKSSRVVSVGGLGLVAVVAALLARLQCGPGFGIGSGAGEDVADEPGSSGQAAEEAVDLGPAVLGISEGRMLSPEGEEINLETVLRIAGEADTAGREVHVAPSSDAFDRTVFELTGALDQAGIEYEVIPP